VSWLEFHEKVHVALVPEVVSESGAEQGKPLDMVPPAEVSKPFLWDVQTCVVRRALRLFGFDSLRMYF